MKHLFVPYKIAYLAKKKGFNKLCCGYYMKSDKSLNFSFSASNDEYTDCLAPLYQQLVDWFRENHNLHISIDSIGRDWYFSLHKFNTTETKQIKETLVRCTDYYENYDDAITEAFNYI